MSRSRPPISATPWSECDRIIAHHTGRPLAQVIDDVGRDRWFDAETALDYGFVDHIVTSLDDVRPTLPTRRIGLARPPALPVGDHR